jgi:hypothetical protein
VSEGTSVYRLALHNLWTGIPMEVRAALATFAAVCPFKTRRESHLQFAQASR